MNTMQLLAGPVAQALGWALLHLLWQATIVAGILAAVLALVPRENANTRYVASISALTLVFLLFLGTAARAYDPGARPITPVPASAQVTSLEVENVPVLIAAIATEGWRERLVSGVATARQSLPSVVAIWLAGVVLLSARLLVSWMRARTLVTHGVVEASPQWQRAAARISEALGLKRAVRLLESAKVEVPSVIGTLRPVILLPASTLTGMSPEHLEMVLAHELAHIRRHDFLVNLLQAFVETLMFYHPAVWWMSRRVRVERENCCDDLAVAVCGNPLQYARALTRLEELRDASFTVAVAANGGSLLDRIRRIAATRAESTGLSSRWAAAVAMLALVVLALAFPSLPALAQRDTEDPTPAEASIDVIDTIHEDDDHDSDFERPETPEAPEAPETPDVDVDIDIDTDLDVPIDIDIDTEELAELEEHRTWAALAPVPPTPAVPPVPMTSRVAPAPRAMPAPAPFPVVAPAPPAPPQIAGAFSYSFHDDDDHGNDREIGSTGKLTVDELISLRASDVTPEYVNEMRAIFPHLTLRNVSGMSAVGVTPAFVREMRAAGIDVSSAREATSLKAVGVTADFVKEMRSAGFEVKSARDASSLRAVGVTAAFIRSMRDAGFPVTTARDATSLSAVGVTPEYVRQIRDAGFKIETARDATSLKAVGVSPEWLREMKSAGVTITSAREATSLKAVGVTSEFVRKLAAAGYTNLSTRELTRLAAAGVDDDFIRSLEQYRKKD
jgi:beta-lactamase regulating signal transducer with metallopeptidase domain